MRGAVSFCITLNINVILERLNPIRHRMDKRTYPDFQFIYWYKTLQLVRQG